MISSVRGKVINKGDGVALVEVGNVGLKVLTSKRTAKKLATGEDARLFTYLYVRENALELYGFLGGETLRLFEMLTSVSGIGPKTALGVLDVDAPDKIIAAIVEKRPDFLTRASGIGKKTAERVILELHNKLELPKSSELTKTMDIDADLEEILVGLGYSKYRVKDVIASLGGEPKKLEDRLKHALAKLSGK